MAELAIGLAADCDNPEPAVAKIFRAKLPGATGLPFVAFITHDTKWVDGYSGFKNTGDFQKVMEKADKSPYLQASKATRKKLAGIVARAEKAAGRGDWKSVMKAAKDTAKTSGRCPERKQMRALVAKAHGWAEAEIKRALKLARSADDLAQARKVLMDVRKRMARLPEADDAAEGLKALRQLTRIHKIEAAGKGKDGLREKAAAKFKESRWAAIFSKQAPAIGGGGDEEEAEEEQEEESEESSIEIGG